MGTVQFPLICLETYKREGHKVKLLESSGSGELFQSMMALGIIEYVEAWEALDYRVAFLPSDLSNESLTKGLNGQELMPFTHIALHPMGFLGTSAASVPWGNHDQAPRLSYQAGMLKQAISISALNVSERMDQGIAYSHWYPQRPIADTIVSESRKMHDWPMGENLMIALCSYEGLSQEDAIVLNQGSVDRGMCRITVHKVFKAIVHRISNTVYEAFENPLAEIGGLPCIGIRGESKDGYSKLDIHGLLTEGIYVKNGDVLIGRVIYTSDDSGNRIRRDRSVILVCEDSENYVVERVMVTTNREGFRQVRVKLRTMRVPQLGDKKSDRHGQKGVIGHLAKQWDLPYVTYGPNAGMTPDAIINLHCIPGRMTLAKMLEMIFSNYGLVTGSFVDATPYTNISAKWAVEQMRLSGYGTEVYMTNGKTGEQMTRPIFLGSCFMQNLKHMVLDKIAARNRGPRAILTRQPVEGRARQGGLRYGEMERDALLAHGASMALNDRFSVASDGNIAAVCRDCGQIGESASVFTLNALKKKETLDHSEKCRVCNGPIKYINTTYCYSNLLVRELAAAGIKIVHSLEKDLEPELPSIESESESDEEMVSSLRDINF
jgi:DNA-directed RNA polymerase II subunit RPB2